MCHAFTGSQILTGTLAYLLYYNLPPIILNNMLLPSRLHLNGISPLTSNSQSFPTIREVIEHFESENNNFDEEPTSGNFCGASQRDNLANLIVFEVIVNG